MNARPPSPASLPNWIGGAVLGVALALVLVSAGAAQTRRPPRLSGQASAVAAAPQPLERRPLRPPIAAPVGNHGRARVAHGIVRRSPGDQWRKQMTTLMEAEATSDRRRERLAGAYNRGFRGYSAMHRRCTPSAQLIITRFLDEGGRIARDVLTGTAADPLTFANDSPRDDAGVLIGCRHERRRAHFHRRIQRRRRTTRCVELRGGIVRRGNPVRHRAGESAHAAISAALNELIASSGEELVAKYAETWRVAFRLGEFSALNRH